jgi:hypothetical protein
VCVCAAALLSCVVGTRATTTMPWGGQISQAMHKQSRVAA